MSLKSYIIGMLAATVLCWFAWVLVLFYIDPDTANVIGFLAFYASLFFALVGTFAIVGLKLRIWRSRKEVLFAYVAPSFRQGIWFSLVVIVCLVLQSFGLLNWWDALLIVLGFSFLEFYFMTR